MKTLALISLLLLTSCASTQDNAQSLLDRLEFGDDEFGCLTLDATIDLNPLPLITSNARMVYKKVKGDSALTC